MQKGLFICQNGAKPASGKGNLMGNDGIILTLKNDVIFKAVYGSDTEECKFVLMALLNHILGREEDPIVSLTYKNPFHLRQHVSEKESILDIKVETGSGELIDIEMQLCSYDYLAERLIYYHGGTIRESLKKGAEYDTMLKTITICIVDEVMFPETEQFLNVFSLLEETTHIALSDMTGICVVELPKVNPEKKPPQELSPLELYLEYLKCADEEGSEKQEELVRLGGKELEMVQHLLKKATEEEILREKALAREKYLRDEAHFAFLREDTKRIQKENERAQKENERMQKENERMQKENERMQKENERMQKELKEQQQAFKEEQQALQNEQQAFQNKQQTLQEEQQSLQEGQRVLKQEQQTFQEKQQTFQEEQRALREERQALKTQMQEAKEGKRDIARKLKADGLSMEKIAAYTGLPAQEIQKL